MIHAKCGKNVEQGQADVKEVKCKSCGKKFRARFTLVCSDCQYAKKACPFCGKP